MKRELTVVFPIFTQDPRGSWVLMGKQAPGKRLAGIRNGYGGKCEVGELPVDCAVREVKEEIGLDLENEKLIYVGSLIENEKEVYFYVYFLNEKIEVDDNNEFVDNKWFEIAKYDQYISEMFPGNLPLMQAVQNILVQLNIGQIFQPFRLDLSDNLELIEKAKKIYD